MKISVISETQDVADIIPALALLNHSTHVLPFDAQSIKKLDECDVVLIDTTGTNLLNARDLCRAVAAAYPALPVVIAIDEASLIAVDSSWAVDEFFLPTTSPVEFDARLRLLMTRQPVPVEEAEDSSVAAVGKLIVDEMTYVARVAGTPLDLTYKEFELLFFLVKNAGRVFSREQLLQEVWGYDYFGGARTVDVHVRRLRAKLGHDYEHLIATVRNVGYKVVPLEES
ncbi:response regulator transcription factor [Corynebacterium sp. 320]|uniref:Response regulator transcription factor n=1 Tax=Corynebacterium zhongnanshanii TaxID=2768834 RepID=A0ABQ6VCF3_9CORY|nr:response regulator transcription factor [Corynebacterium sp. 320]KAB1550792.1 response regulator transcription factor [Corynebacterium sp. 321]KAB1551149.1 response regulator transcription factor [Corynebacterium sp. 319]KAB3519793.1 response regulator transcription factor [Corynebacterium zhongnanshanii]KAB3526794.1 response regulator transcription factor [Corynebacterium sp. 250]KAB3538289.1 response regulator transcription factor [Corynebacterium sp. 366]MCR5914720.1 DNA-binding respons